MGHGGSWMLAILAGAGGASAQLICEEGGSGMIFPLFPNEHEWPLGLRAVLYLVGLLWTFMGVGIIADMFMGAIETITSSEMITETKTGAKVPVKVWNATVANLTLMALGSSAPEILLNVLEIIGNDYFAGDLGPSTIVGSAAFNLMVIIAVCNLAVAQAGIERKIEITDVYGCTAFFSIFAYIWLVVILKVISPNVVELWEALFTFGFFPLLVGLAWCLDNGYISLGAKKGESHITQIGSSHFHPYEIEKYLADFEAKHGEMTPEQREDMMITALQAKVKPSRAQYRMMATRNMTGGKRIKIPPKVTPKQIEMSSVATNGGGADANLTVVNFKASAYSVLESVGRARVVVTRSSAQGSLQVDYATEGVTANAGEDFVETSGVLTFSPGEEEKEIEVPIIDDDEPEEDEMFIVKLANPRPNARLGAEGMTIVTIIDDDDPGLIGFKDEETHATAQESDGEAHIFVSRFKGSSGTVTVKYRTVSISATGGYEGDENCDYTDVEGVLTFAPEEMRHEIKVPIVNRKQYDKAETFKVVLSNVQGPNEKATLAEFNQCIVTIIHNGETRDVIDRVTKVLNINADKFSVGTSSWSDQWKDVWTVGDDQGVDGLEDGAEPYKPTPTDYFLWALALPWKIWFATTPPTEFFGGWLCFVVALIYIGVVTGMIADLANLFGCTIGLANEITAITLVALGTSLPDTFASKTAAMNDESADACIGNVTGSNSVNVFLGLGMPWSIAAIYWAIYGKNDEWVKRYGGDDDKYTGDDDLNSIEVYKDYGTFPGFVVPAGSLGFSVIVFTLCACTTLALLSYRRMAYGCELGGPIGPAQIHSCIFFGLWLLYVTLSSLQITGTLDSGPL